MALINVTGQVLDEKYRIEKNLGRGGMGSVYLATHLGTDRPVAVKLIAPQFMRQSEFVERFRREAKAAGRLRHPNVVDVTDFGFAAVGSEKVAYLVMEYLDGCTLAEVLSEESSLALDWVADILEQVCSAVDEAHRQGIVHRDLKPDNIWLEPNRRGGYTVKVLDFGLAKLADAPAGQIAEGEGLSPSHHSIGGNLLPHTTQAHSASTKFSPPVADTEFFEGKTLVQPSTAGEDDQTAILVRQVTQEIAEPSLEDAETRIQPSTYSAEDDETRILDNSTQEDSGVQQTSSAYDLTRVGSILGTPTYMSPEQCRGDALDARSDIYSIGVIAYQMLCGHPPFSGEMNEVIRQHIETPPPPLRAQNKKIPKKVARLVMSALAKDPAARPATAAGFASALRASAEGVGVLLRNAIALYIQQFPKFFRLSVLLHVPMMVVTLMQFGNEVMIRREVISEFSGSISRVVIGLLSFFVNYLAALVLVGMIIRLVTELFLAPLRPVKLRTAFAALKKRFWPLLLAGAMASISSFIGMIIFEVPGVVLFIWFSLVGPVVMMENIKGRAALRRSKTLVKRSLLTVIGTLMIQWLMPVIASAVLVSMLIILLKNSNLENAKELAARITSIITVGINVFFVPLIATLTALLYLKTRRIGGETLKEVLDQLEEENAPRTKWQSRIRERLQLKTPSSH